MNKIAGKAAGKKSLPGFLLIGATLALLLLILQLPVKMNRRVDLAPLDALPGPYMLLYFGYPGCGNTCPLTLSTLARVYRHYYRSDQANAAEPTLRVVFINLIDNATAAQSSRYAQGFHQDFTALQLTPDEMVTATTAFGLKFTRLQADGELFHLGYLYLLQKQAGTWRIKTVYTDNEPQQMQILADLRGLKDQV